MEQKAGLKYLKKAKSNLNSSKILYKNEEKINAVYFLQQTVELLSKSFLMYLGAEEKQLKNWIGHDCIMLHEIFNIYNEVLIKQGIMPIDEARNYIKKIHYTTIPEIFKDSEHRFLDENGKKTKEYTKIIDKYAKMAKKLDIQKMIQINKHYHTKSDMVLLLKPNSNLNIKFPTSLLYYTGLLNDISIDLLNLTVMFPDGAINQIRYTTDTKNVKKYLSNYKKICDILDKCIYTLEILINEYQDINSLN
ncbi:HEPN domain-containing protein [Methanococcus sp. CF]